MTVLSRGARPRRGNRRPGWLLLTVLLVLAIVASSALVFTDRVELLKLAVILALWAAVVAAFVSVIYRRQSDVDQARARDLKLVYDLQLDREISARREYELTVESQLRRELASELRAQAADEVAALRAELSALRANLEILFGADLEHRPAIERDRARAASGQGRIRQQQGPDRVKSSRVSPVREDETTRTAESPIIDVAEEPGFRPPPYSGSHRRAGDPEPSAPPRSSEQPQRQQRPSPPARAPQPAPSPAPVPEPVFEPPAAPEPVPTAEPVMSVPPPPPPVAPESPLPAHEPVMAAPPAPAPPPRPEPAPQRRGRHAPPPDLDGSDQWRPVQAEGQWLPPGAPGSNWVAPEPAPEPVGEPAPEPQPEPEPAPTPAPATSNGVNGYVGRRRAPDESPAWPVDPPRGRHGRPADPAAPVAATPPQAQSAVQDEAERRARHSGLGDEDQQPTPPAPADNDSQHVEGQSVAELMARLQVATPGGGRRRRRED